MNNCAKIHSNQISYLDSHRKTDNKYFPYSSLLLTKNVVRKLWHISVVFINTSHNKTDVDERKIHAQHKNSIYSKVNFVKHVIVSF